MKMRVRFLGLLAGALILASCADKVAEEIFRAFVTDTFSVDFQVEPIPIAPVGIDSVAVSGEPMNLDSIIRDRTDGAFGMEDVKAVYLEKLVLTLDSGDAANNLANFDMLKLSLRSADGSKAVEVCNTVIPDSFSTSRSLPVKQDKDLKPILSGNSLTYLVGIGARRVTTKRMTGKLQFSFDVK